MNDQDLKKKHEKRIKNWWKTTAGQRKPEVMERITQELKRDRTMLFNAFAERADGGDLADCLVRVVENSFTLAHYTGMRRGYLLGVKVGKNYEEDQIIKIVSKKLDATPTEMAEMIDEYNSRFVDADDKHRVRLRPHWPDIGRTTERWIEAVKDPRVKNFLKRARERAEQIHRVEFWKRIMREHDKNRK